MNGRRLALRFCGAWALITLSGYLMAPHLAALGGPLLAKCFGAINPGLLVSLLPEAAAAGHLVLHVTVVLPLAIGEFNRVPGGATLTLETSALHVLLPSALLLVVSLALPAPTCRTRVLGLLLATFLAVLLAGGMLLVQWSGLLALNLQDAAMQAGIPHAPAPVAGVLVFLEGGGRWLLGLILGIGPTVLLQRVTAAP